MVLGPCGLSTNTVCASTYGVVTYRVSCSRQGPHCLPEDVLLLLLLLTDSILPGFLQELAAYSA